MKYIILMLLVSVAIISCVPHERTQYKAERVTLIDIIERFRLDENRKWIKSVVYLYRTDKGYEFELDYPYEGSAKIGSQHIVPLHR